MIARRDRMAPRDLSKLALQFRKLPFQAIEHGPRLCGAIAQSGLLAGLGAVPGASVRSGDGRARGVVLESVS